MQNQHPQPEELHLRHTEWPEFNKIKFQDRLQSNLAGCQRELDYHEDSVLSDFFGVLLLHDKKNIAGAIIAFEKAIQLNPNNHIASANLNYTKKLTGTEVQQVSYTGTNEQKGLAWWSRGFYHMRMYQHSDAVRCFESALKFLPNEPKLMFYFAVVLNRPKKRETRSRALQFLCRDEMKSVNKFEVLSQLIRAIGGALPIKKAEPVIKNHLKKARTLFKQEQIPSPLLKRSFSRVLVSAADEYRSWKHNQEALALFNEAINCANQNAGTRAYHNRAMVLLNIIELELLSPAQVEANRNAAKDDLQTAIQLEPNNYAAAIDLVKLLQQSRSRSDLDKALEVCTRTLFREDCDPGLLNKIVLRSLQMQLLLDTGRSINEIMLKAIIPLITVYQTTSPLNPVSAKELANIKLFLFKRWEDHLKQQDPQVRVSRLIDILIWLRELESAKSNLLIVETALDADDVLYQRMRINSLGSYIRKEYNDSADQLIGAASYQLRLAAAGDLFLKRRNAAWPGNDDEVERPALAVKFPTFRSAVATTVLRSLPADFSNFASNSIHLVRCLRTLQLLTPGLESPAASSSSTDQEPGHIIRTRELAAKTFEHIHRLFSEDPMWNRLDVPDSVMKTVAIVWRALSATGLLNDQSKSTLYNICGTTRPHCYTPDTSSPLAPLLTFGKNSGDAELKLNSRIKSLVAIRQLHLDIFVSELQPEMDVYAQDVAIKLVIETKTLLEYYISAFPIGLSLTKVSKSSKLNFPSIPPNKTGSSEDLLNKSLKLPNSADFKTQFPLTFAVLLDILPHRDPIINAWLNDATLVRNTELHSHSVVLASKHIPCCKTRDYVELAHEVMKKLPTLLQNLKQALDTDFASVQSSASSSSASSVAIVTPSPSSLNGTTFDPVEYLDEVQAQLNPAFRTNPPRSLNFFLAALKNSIYFDLLTALFRLPPDDNQLQITQQVELKGE